MYLAGLLQNGARKSAWDKGAVGGRHQALLAGSSDDAARVFVLDDTAFPKAGTDSVDGRTTITCKFRVFRVPTNFQSASSGLRVAMSMT